MVNLVAAVFTTVVGTSIGYVIHIVKNKQTLNRKENP